MQHAETQILLVPHRQWRLFDGRSLPAMSSLTHGKPSLVTPSSFLSKNLDIYGPLQRAKSRNLLVLVSTHRNSKLTRIILVGFLLVKNVTLKNVTIIPFNNSFGSYGILARQPFQNRQQLLSNFFAESSSGSSFEHLKRATIASS